MTTGTWHRGLAVRRPGTNFKCLHFFKDDDEVSVCGRYYFDTKTVEKGVHYCPGCRHNISKNGFSNIERDNEIMHRWRREYS